MSKEKLFGEFFPVSTETWKAKIKADLKGADYDKKLVWHTDEGFDIQPFYRQDDLAPLNYLQALPGKFPFIRGKKVKENHWKINQFIRVETVEKAHQEALYALAGGANSLAFDINVEVTFQLLENLLADVDGENIPLNFRVPNPLDLPALLLKLAKQRDWNPAKLTGSIFCDPLSQLNLEAKGSDYSQMERLFNECFCLPAFHCITVDGGVFNNSGGSTVSEMAFTLSVANAYMLYMTEKNYDAGLVAEKMRFSFAVGSNYFMEMAKFRALRFLWAKILTAYGVPEDKAGTYLHAINAQGNKTVYDPYVNMLRTTTETMSAVLGGVDVITVLPFDGVFEVPDEKAKRVARNQQLILKEESFFDKVADPASGSYYIETLTDKLIHQAWNLFLEVDEKGGYEIAFRQGFIQERIQREANKKDLDIASRKRSILGVNQFPNTNEFIEKELPAETFFMLKQEEALERLQPYRYAAPFEALRYRTDQYAEKNSRPKVCLFTYGNMAMRRARAQFTGNFFGCAGYEIIDHPGFNSLADGIAAAKKEKPEIVVLCSSDEEYAEIALPVFESLKKESLVVLAGYPKTLVEKLKAAGMQNFIHAGANVLEELKRYQKLLGIDR